MHKFMQTLGFGPCRGIQEEERLLRRLAKSAGRTLSLEEEDGSQLCELRTEVSPGMGVAQFGRLSPRGTFTREYYFPYVLGSHISSNADCQIQRHTALETYAGLLDEYRIGISLIFYIENSAACRARRLASKPAAPRGVRLSGLASQGHILLPVAKTRQQEENSRRAARQHGTLMEAALQGDEEAIETLTMEDIDTYSMLSRRILTEDIYSIIDTCFMPYGIECDQYSIVGSITSFETRTNHLTGAQICLLQLSCNDIDFSVAINRQDLLGEPAPGRRFKGQIWMTGTVEFN